MSQADTEDDVRAIGTALREARRKDAPSIEVIVQRAARHRRRRHAARGCALGLAVAVAAIAAFQLDRGDGSTSLATMPDETTVGDTSSSSTATTVGLAPLPTSSFSPTSQPTTDGSAVRVPHEVTVIAVNGSRISGIATALTSELVDAGYATAPAADAIGPLDTSNVAYAPGYEADARALADRLCLEVEDSPTLASLDIAGPRGLEGVNVAVFLGGNGPDIVLDGPCPRRDG